MATSEQLKALMRSFAEADEERFYSVAMQMAAHAARNGHGKLARELRALVDEAKAKATRPGHKPVPVKAVVLDEREEVTTEDLLGALRERQSGSPP